MTPVTLSDLWQMPSGAYYYTCNLAGELGAPETVVILSREVDGTPVITMGHGSYIRNLCPAGARMAPVNPREQISTVYGACITRQVFDSIAAGHGPPDETDMSHYHAEALAVVELLRRTLEETVA